MMAPRVDTRSGWWALARRKWGNKYMSVAATGPFAQCAAMQPCPPLACSHARPSVGQYRKLLKWRDIGVEIDALHGELSSIGAAPDSALEDGTPSAVAAAASHSMRW